MEKSKLYHSQEWPVQTATYIAYTGTTYSVYTIYLLTQLRNETRYHSNLIAETTPNIGTTRDSTEQTVFRTQGTPSHPTFPLLRCACI